jgi:hypothetical protein
MTGGETGPEFWVKGLGWVKREEVGEEVGSAGRCHRGARDGVSGGFEPNPSRREVQTQTGLCKTLGFTALTVGEVSPVITQCGSAPMVMTSQQKWGNKNRHPRCCHQW